MAQTHSHENVGHFIDSWELFHMGEINKAQIQTLSHMGDEGACIIFCHMQEHIKQ